MDDLCRQVSWLTALAPASAFPRMLPNTRARSGICEAGLPLTVAGAASAFRTRAPVTVFPFHPHAPCDGTETVTLSHQQAGGARVNSPVVALPRQPSGDAGRAKCATGQFAASRATASNSVSISSSTRAQRLGAVAGDRPVTNDDLAGLS